MHGLWCYIKYTFIPVTIRGYEDRDAEDVWSLHERALKEVGAFVAGHGEWDEDLKNVHSIYTKNGGVFYVVDYGGKVIGMGALKRLSDKRAEIKRMRVELEHQGKGLGKKLLFLLEDKAAELGYTELQLDTSVKQEAAVHLYRKHGYREYKRGMLGGLETIWMEKKL